MCTGGKPLILGGDTGGVVLPLLGDTEAEWSDGVRAALYAIGLAWCFLGVSIIADVFMGAIEKVTSQKRSVKNKDGKTITVTVWNSTVANLTLMALGSSAPEILLSVIELCLTNKMHSGDLGPSTIVGSAAFNLMVIMAVCVSALPPNETRRIDELGVYCVTASFSVLAYLWLLVILVYISPDVVEIWEGAVTFAFFPLLVFVAYLFDIHVLTFNFSSVREPKKMVLSPHTTGEDLAKMWDIIRQKYGAEKSTAEMQALLQYEFAPGLSRAAHRVQMGRQLYGKKKSGITASRRFSMNMNPMHMKASFSNPTAKLPKVGFERSRYAVLETDGKVSIKVVRDGQPSAAFKVKVRTVENTATEGDDYRKVDKELVFEADILEQVVDVEIVHDLVAESTEDFFVELYNPSDCQLSETISQCTVVIIDADYGGRLAFKESVIDVTEKHEDQSVMVEVHRHGGSYGIVGCSYHTEDGSAKAGYDYEDTSGKLEFKEGVLSQTFEVKIKSKKRWEGHEKFRVMLTDPVKTEFPAETDGGKDVNILTINIKPDAEKKTFVESALGAVNWHEMELGSTNWKEQFAEAVLVGGSWSEMAKASNTEMIMHIVAMPWKLLFAVVPPVDFLQGWICFVISLVMIGCVTAVIGDLAMLLGCSLGICDSVTAITFVALGTSLPDTFASKSAAVGDENADNSIGNVTGSNSVNVFLGLGLPWTIGSIYWHLQGRTEAWVERGVDRAWPDHIFKDYPDGAFVVPAAGLSDSVSIFTACAVCVIFTLGVRRFKLGAELGGGKTLCYITSGFFSLLWVAYIVLSIVLLDC